MLALDVFSFCFPDEGHGGNLPLYLFHKLCVHMHGNKAKFELCLFSPLGYYHMTYMGKQNS